MCILLFYIYISDDLCMRSMEYLSSYANYTIFIFVYVFMDFRTRFSFCNFLYIKILSKYVGKFYYITEITYIYLEYT